MPQRKCVHEGTCYPTNHVGAVFAWRLDADEAAEALRAAGFADIAVFHGQDAYVTIRDASRNLTAFTRAWRRVRDLGDEGEFHWHSLSALRYGGSYLIVRVGTSAQARRARDVLLPHYAHDIWYLGAWTVERLSEEQGSIQR